MQISKATFFFAKMAAEIFLSRVLRAPRCSEQISSLTGEPQSQSGVGRTPHPCKAAVSWPPSEEPLSLHLFLLLSFTITPAAAATVPYCPSTSISPSFPSFPTAAQTLPQPSGWQKPARAHLVPAIYPEQLLQTFGFTRSSDPLTPLCVFDSVCTHTPVDTRVTHRQSTTSWSGTVVSQQQSNWKKKENHQPTPTLRILNPSQAGFRLR